MQRRAVLIFARGPRAEAAAKRVPERIFRDVLDAWRRAARVCNADAILATAQRGATFGERLANAAADAFARGYDALLVTGIDTPPVPQLEEAFVAVERGAVAIAPSTDGGVNVIAIRREDAPILATFEQRDQDLAARCIASFAQVFLLASSTDIDSTRSLRQASRECVWRDYFHGVRFGTRAQSFVARGFESGPALRAPPRSARHDSWTTIGTEEAHAQLLPL